MIEDPPLLTVRRSFSRPSAAQLAAFAGTPTGFVADAMNGRGALDHRIKPIGRTPAVFAGVAITCHAGPADNLALFGALANGVPGDIMVCATDGFAATAVTGRRSSTRRSLGSIALRLAASAFAYVATGIPGLSERHTLVGSAHAGTGSDLDRFSEQVQKATDQTIADIDAALAAKEKEIMHV